MKDKRAVGWVIIAIVSSELFLSLRAEAKGRLSMRCEDEVSSCEMSDKKESRWRGCAHLHFVGDHRHLALSLVSRDDVAHEGVLCYHVGRLNT